MSNILTFPNVISDISDNSRVKSNRKFHKTGMHSSRMRTGRSWTVCWSQHPGGGGSARSRGVVCLVPGGWVCQVPKGSARSQGGWVCQVPGGSARSWGDLPGPGGYDIPACTEADTLPPCGQTDTCKNITLATTSLRPVMKVS